MYKLLQKHGKKLLAVFSAVLMIAFILPTSSRYGGMGRNPIVGTVAGEKLTAQEMNSARASWDILTHTRIKSNPQAVLAMALPRPALMEIQAHPQLFMLLLKEAQQMGISVGNDQLNDVLTNDIDTESLDDERAANVRRAVIDLLLVRNAFQRAASTVKISEPMVQHSLAQDRQSIVVNLLEFNAAKYADKLPPPTTQEVQAQFDKYADVIKGAVDPKTNPHGFGYKYPNRLKLQYIAVPRSLVRKSVEISPPPGTDQNEKNIAYAWEKEARKYYIQHPEQFPTTQASTEPSDSFSLGGGGAKKKTTTRPFEQAKQDVIDRIVGPETTIRLARILDFTNNTMASDYLAWRNASGAGASAAATKPLSSLGVPYDSFDYLKKLADKVQAQFKVLPTVETINDRYLTAEDLSKLPKIGESSASDVGDLSTYLMGRTFAFVSPEHREDSGVLHLFEPSKVLRDESDTDYIARVSDAQAAHKPATLAEVEPGVRADVVSAKAYEQARADAQKLYEKAKEGSLKEIGGSSVITAGPILNRPGPIPGYPISGNAADVFIPEVFKLVSTAPAKPSVKPTTLIEIPTAEKAIVAQLQDVSPLFNTNTMPLEAARLRMTMSNQLTQLLGQRWFDYQTVAQRTHYVPDPAYQKEEPTGPSQPRPPVQPPIF